MRDANLEVAKQSFIIESQCLKDAFSHIDKKQFANAIDALANAQRIAASACGHSGIACQHFAHLMCCIERPAKFIPPSEAIHGGMGFLHSGDVMLLASRGGKTAELFPILEYCKAHNITVISVTENTDSPIARKADIVLNMYITRETDRFNCQGTTSYAVLNAIFDALQVTLIEEINYQVEQFASVHPGGAVGERLNK